MVKLTISEALQRAIAFHEEGKAQDAERLYRAILQSKPAHPDANHNLGILAVASNKIDVALPLFKTALTANPKKNQFWFSYIDALIKNKKFEAANQVIEQVKRKGMAANKLTVFEMQLNATNQASKSQLSSQKKNLTFGEKHQKLTVQKKQKKKKPHLKDKYPSQQTIKKLLQYYKTGQFGGAEQLAMDITKEFPKHHLSWKVLGAVFGHTKRLTESVDANRKAIALSPQDAGTHFNLGNTLKEMGRLNEAEVSFRQAIGLQADFAEAHFNLGNTLRQLGRLDEAEASYRETIEHQADLSGAHNNLASTLRMLGRLDEAIAIYKQQITLKPNYADAHSNLGATLQEVGRLDEAEAYYTQAVALKPSHAEAHYNLGNLLKELGRLDEAVASYTQAITLNPKYVKTHNELLTCLYLLDEQTVFFDKLDYLIKQDVASAVIGSLTCRSALKYGLEKPNLFCRNPLEYVLHTNLNTRYNFEEIFVKKVKSILNENPIQNRNQNLLMNGYQTSGNLFDIQNDSTNEIQKAIRFEIERYRKNFNNSEEGLIKKWPTEYILYGWLISMKNGGELQPHIHSQGWLSGSIYINIPMKSRPNSGNLVVAVGEEKDATDTRINPQNSINVVTGSLVLFPASLTHHTIPFESEEERIVLAFDVKEK